LNLSKRNLSRQSFIFSTKSLLLQLNERIFVCHKLFKTLTSVKNKRYYLPIFIIIFLLGTSQAGAQIGGNSVYKFLNLTSSARTAAMGSNNLAIMDNDVGLALFNPSLITPEMHNNLSMSFVDYYTDVNYGFATYARDFKKLGTYTGSIQYLNYGSFNYADATGTDTLGTFTAGDLALNVGWGRQLDSLFSIGANLKFIHSGYEEYKSYGLAVDVAGSYHNSKHNLTVSFIARNIGTQLKPYRSGNYEPLPFEMTLGMSQRLKHLPFRYSILLTNLQKWDLTYYDANDPDNKTDPFTGETEEQNGFADFADKAFRHVVIGGEFIPSKFLSFRAGYNYQRRQELGVYNKMGMVGFSWGLGLKISVFQFDYARATYHLNGSPNYISLRMSLGNSSSNEKTFLNNY